METLDNILGGVEAQNTAAQEAVRTSTEQAQEEIDTLRAKVLAGDRTGLSPLDKGIIVLWGGRLASSPNIVERYKSVADQLTDKKGEPVVVIDRVLEQLGWDMSDPPYALRTFLYMGRLSGSQIKFDFSELTAHLPTSAYVRNNGRFLDAIGEPEKGPLQVDDTKFSFFKRSQFQLGLDLGRPLDLKGKNLKYYMVKPGKPQLKMEVLVGYSGIKDWLNVDGLDESKNRALRIMRNMAPKLKLDQIEPATQYQKISLRIP